MSRFLYIALRERPELKRAAAAWFHLKWGVPEDAYLACMDAYLNVYTEEEYRGQGIAGALLNFAVDDMRSKGITPLYLVTDHVGFYERYGWEFLCMVRCKDKPETSRMYIHR